VTRERIKPAYLKLTDLLRADIAAGRFGPGDRLPSETQLMLRHKVTRSVAKRAISVLKADGLVEGRQGAGIFVRVDRRIVRDPQSEPAGEIDRWTLRSEEMSADPAIADRLAIPPGQLVIRTSARYVGDEAPLSLMLSWRPTRPAPSLVVDQVRERVIVRPAGPDEIAALRLPSRGSVVVIIQTRLAGGIPVDAADIVIPSDRCELSYDLPASGPHHRSGG
jgi:DNA-binding GntR family transcriptional regulator